MLYGLTMRHYALSPSPFLQSLETFSREAAFWRASHWKGGLILSQRQYRLLRLNGPLSFHRKTTPLRKWAKQCVLVNVLRRVRIVAWVEHGSSLPLNHFQTHLKAQSHLGPTFAGIVLLQNNSTDRGDPDQA